MGDHGALFSDWMVQLVKGEQRINSGTTTEDSDYHG